MWGSPTSRKSLSFGVDAESFNKKHYQASSVAPSSSSVFLNLTLSDDVSLEDFSNVGTDSITEEEPLKQSSYPKGKILENQVPRLIDNKRKHVEKALFSGQRDQLLLQEGNSQCHKTLAETSQKSNRVFAE